MSLIKPNRTLLQRRDVLRLATAAPAFAMGGFSAQTAMAFDAPDMSNPTHFSFTMGQAKITVVSDGWFPIPMSGQAINAPEAEKLAFLADHFMPTDEGYSHTNHMFIELGEAKVLVDVGSGSRFADTTGALMGNLDAAGIDPDSITHVAITHAHPDHIWGIRDDFDEPIFPDAEYVMGEAEHAHWMQDDLVNRVAPTEQSMVLGAVNSITAEGLEWTLVQGGAEIAPGIRLIDSPGHTPGHMSVQVESEGKMLIAVGDSLSNPYLNFRKPNWYNGFDADGELTVATRKRLLDMAATDRVAVLGYHFPFPGVGHVKRDGEVYDFVPALWKF